MKGKTRWSGLQPGQQVETIPHQRRMVNKYLQWEAYIHTAFRVKYDIRLVDSDTVRKNVEDLEDKNNKVVWIHTFRDNTAFILYRYDDPCLESISQGYTIPGVCLFSYRHDENTVRLIEESFDVQIIPDEIDGKSRDEESQKTLADETTEEDEEDGQRRIIPAGNIPKLAINQTRGEYVKILHRQLQQILDEIANRTGEERITLPNFTVPFEAKAHRIHDINTEFRILIQALAWVDRRIMTSRDPESEFLSGFVNKLRTARDQPEDDGEASGNRTQIREMNATTELPGDTHVVSKTLETAKEDGKENLNQEYHFKGLEDEQENGNNYLENQEATCQAGGVCYTMTMLFVIIVIFPMLGYILGYISPVPAYADAYTVNHL